MKISVRFLLFQNMFVLFFALANSPVASAASVAAKSPSAPTVAPTMGQVSGCNANDLVCISGVTENPATMGNPPPGAPSKNDCLNLLAAGSADAAIACCAAAFAFERNPELFIMSCRLTVTLKVLYCNSLWYEDPFPRSKCPTAVAATVPTGTER